MSEHSQGLQAGRGAAAVTIAAVVAEVGVEAMTCLGELHTGLRLHHQKHDEVTNARRGSEERVHSQGDALAVVTKVAVLKP